MIPKVYDSRTCELGEGPFWHPERAELFWFDILGKRLMSLDGEWQFDEHVSAGGWIDRDTLLVASETALLRFDLRDGSRERLVAVEAENPDTRSNDGRADPWGGFWIGTMSKTKAKGAGTIYRFCRGELRPLFSGISTTNAISFTPDRRFAHFADTPTGKVMRVRLGSDGWPEGEPELFLDLSGEGLRPDGATCDAEGRLWVAQWGAGRVACYDTQGGPVEAVVFPAPQTSCPAFGGPGLSTLFCTTAREGMDEAALAAAPESGRTFAVEGHGPGQPENRVIL